MLLLPPILSLWQKSYFRTACPTGPLQCRSFPSHSSPSPVSSVTGIPRRLLMPQQPYNEETPQLSAKGRLGGGKSGIYLFIYRLFPGQDRPGLFFVLALFFLLQLLVRVPPPSNTSTAVTTTIEPVRSSPVTALFR